MPRAQSADGVIHDFPDGTDPAVIDRVIKQYANEQAPHTAARETSAPSPLASYLSEGLGALKGAIPEIGAAAKDIGQAFVPGQPVSPALHRVGDIAQFLTGGLTSPLGAEGRMLDPATRIGEARNLARELKAPAQIEKLEAVKPAAKVPFGSHVADYLGVLEAVQRGDWKWLTLSLGRKGAETAMDWARNPSRRIEDLKSFVDARRQARVGDAQRFVDEHGSAGLDELKRMIESFKNP